MTTRSGIDVMIERGMTIGDDMTAEDFAKANLPMVVQCSGCTMTMALPSARVDSADLVWCADCLGE